MTLETEQPAAAGSDAMDASRARAESILAAAHWKPHPEWGCFTKGSLVAGVQPDGRAMHIKDWARIPAGHPLHSADTPDEPHEAAEWLVRTFGNGAPAVPTFHVESTPMEPPETDALWSPEEEAPDLGAELLEVQDEEGQDSGDDEQAAAVNLAPDGDSGGQWVDSDLAGSGGDFQPASAASEGAGAGSAYPGIAILEDDLGRRRNQVLAAITSRELLLHDVAADPSRRDFLAQAFSDYQNANALGLPLTEAQSANYYEYLELQGRDSAISRAAHHCARAALEADLAGLERIAAGLEDALR